MMSFMTLKNITKRFDNTVAVDRINLAVEEGELVFFLGPSGCGKTTLLRVIAGLEIPDAGRILLKGNDLALTPARLRNFGMVFQSYSLFPNMTLAQNVSYGLECHGWTNDAKQKRVKELLDMMHLEDHKDKYPSQLSGGQQQRVALARALAPNPLVLLLDEPLSALDAKVRAELRGEVRDLQKRFGITTVMVTHDQEEAMEMADRIVVMNQGRIEQVGTSTDLYYRPTNLFVAHFLGKMNKVRLDSAGQKPPTLAGRRLCGAGDQHPETTSVYVRPEAVEILKDSRPGTNRFTGRVIKTSFLGNLTRVEMEVAGQPIAAELRYKGASSLQAGEEVTVYFPPEAVLTIVDS
jgi:ABC-type Fe3+/spermidine/putrescine transport system ATPase subunit